MSSSHATSRIYYSTKRSDILDQRRLIVILYAMTTENQKRLLSASHALLMQLHNRLDSRSGWVSHDCGFAKSRIHKLPQYPHVPIYVGTRGVVVEHLRKPQP